MLKDVCYTQTETDQSNIAIFAGPVAGGVVVIIVIIVVVVVVKRSEFLTFLYQNGKKYIFR